MKKVISLILIMILCSSLSACSGDHSANASDANNPAHSANAPNADNSDANASNADVPKHYRFARKNIRVSQYFNTLSASSDWGDEANFLRAAEVQNGVLAIDAKAFLRQELLLKKGVRYSLIGYVHNTSEKACADITVSFSYPEVIRADATNRASATISTASNKTGKGNLIDKFTLKSTDDLELQWLAGQDPNAVLVVDRKQKNYSAPLTTATADGKITHTVSLAAVPPDEYYMIFIIVRAVLTE